MKTYVLIISRTFPAYHARKGLRTFFVESIKKTLDIDPILPHLKIFPGKNQTIRANYTLWKKRIKAIQEGKAVLSLRYWSGKPRQSKQVEICKLGCGSGIGISELIMYADETALVYNDTKLSNVFWSDLANNDGLSHPDFREWFKNYDLSESLAIIHFTPHRY